MTTRIDVVTLFPDLVAAVTHYGITGRAVERGLLQLATWNPRNYTEDRHRTVDDRPYGGGPGMVMKAEPLARAVQEAKAARSAPWVVYLSPQGRRLDQAGLHELAARELVLVAGRYEGVDERFLTAYVDEEWSLGDYVLSGGELGAMVIIDGIARLLPGALGHADSAEQDSFARGLLDCPHYTRPPVFNGQTVPAVLSTGNHAQIAAWRRRQALLRTAERRPDLLAGIELTAADRDVLLQAGYWPSPKTNS